MKPYEPELPTPETHSPEKIAQPSEADFADLDKTKQEIETRATGLPPFEPAVAPSVEQPPSNLSDFERSSWGPRGSEFARFHHNGSDVMIFMPLPGNKDIAVEIVSGWDMRGHGGPDQRRSTVLRLSKAKARALASAIMGAAAEL